MTYKSILLLWNALGVQSLQAQNPKKIFIPPNLKHFKDKQATNSALYFSNVLFCFWVKVLEKHNNYLTRELVEEFSKMLNIYVYSHHLPMPINLLDFKRCHCNCACQSSCAKSEAFPKFTLICYYRMAAVTYTIKDLIPKTELDLQRMICFEKAIKQNKCCQ